VETDIIYLIHSKAKDIKNADLQGQPQWRRKEIIIGFPSPFGIGRLEDEGALEPISGTGASCRAGRLFQELSSWRKVMLLAYRDCPLNDNPGCRDSSENRHYLHHE
jgi:hypothetical protein